MKRIISLIIVTLSLAAPSLAEDIAGKFAFGFEQGIGVGGDDANLLGRGCSFKLCLSNVIAIQAILGLDYSQKSPEVRSPDDVLAYAEEKNKMDYTAGIYGILVLRRFERVHLNGMTGLLIAFRDNHFNDEIKTYSSPDSSFKNSGEGFKRTDVHLRILVAPEIFIFPNFSLEYKYGFDIAIKTDDIQVRDPVHNSDFLMVERKRLTLGLVGDLNLLQSASVHFYF